MKMFWEVLGMKEKLYTGHAVKYVIDKKTRERYEIGEGKLYKQKDYPKNLLESSTKKANYEFYYGVPFDKKPDRIEKVGIFGKTRRIYTTVHPKELEKEFLKVFGLWKIEGLDLYTSEAVDYIRDKTTRKEYRRGEIKLFFNEDMTPFPLVEHTDKYEYIYEINSSTTTNDLQEIRTILTFDSIFGKK